MKNFTLACFVNILLLGLIVESKAQNISFPDANFKQALIDLGIDTDGDYEISQSEAAGKTGPLQVSNKNITDITGIKYFTGISAFVCFNNEISSLDISENTFFLYFNCSINQLNSLDLSANTVLKHLYCTDNQLSSLDLSKNTALTTLVCNNNKFPFSTLQQIKEHFPALNYTSNKKIFSEQEENYGFVLDYSAEVTIDGNITSFTWYDDSGNIINDASVIAETTPGKFQFLKPGIYHCKMTNAAFAGLELQTENITIEDRTTIDFPDPNFKQALLNHDPAIDTNGDNEISQSEAAAFTGTLNVSNKNISDLTGIEYFINIIYLFCHKNQLSSLDLSQNTALTRLSCYGNQLISLDVTKNTALEFLSFSSNQLSSLDLSQNAALEELYGYNNRLSSLDVNPNTAFDAFNINHNKFPFSVLQIIKNNVPSLTYTSDSTIFSPREEVYGFELDYSAEVSIEGNPTEFTWYDDSNNEVDASIVQEQSTPGVFKFLKNGIYYCKMTNAAFSEVELKTETITIKTILTIPNANFKAALVANSAINTDGDKEISQSEAAAFTGTLNVSKKSITDLTGIEHFTNITALDCSQNQLSSLNVSKNTALKYLTFYNNQINSLDISLNTSLTLLYCTNNRLSSLDVSSNTDLKYLHCDNNLFPFSVLKQIKDEFSSFAYSSDSTIFIPREGVYGFEVNYSAEVTIGENETVFTWYDENGEVDGTAVEEQNTKGIFRFLKPGAYYCKMTNDSFSGIELQTKTITISGILNIPDINFKAALVGNTEVNIDGDTEISETEAAAFTGTLDVSDKNIADLTGIEYFTNIIGLNCEENGLTSFNLSQNTELKYLWCSDNQLNELEVSKNTKLEWLYCSKNNVSKLDVSQNTELTRLICYENQLDELDISQNTKLTALSCGKNYLSSLDLSNNSNLKAFSFLCSDNKLPFSELKPIKDAIGALFNYSSDVPLFSPLEGLSGLEVNYSAEATIDGKETVFIWYDENGEVDDTAVEEQANKGVFKFLKPGAYYCKMTNGHFSGTELQTDTITITSTINIPDVNFKDALLANSEINTNGDGEIWESEATAFTGTIDVSDKNIENLTGIEYFTNIIGLNCEENGLTSFNLSQNTELKYLWCSDNQLSELDVSKNTKLEWLYCSKNNVSKLNVSQNTELTRLICYENQLDELDISQNTKLTALSCGKNYLSSLDLSNNSNLKAFSFLCSDNKLPFSELKPIKDAIGALFNYSSDVPLFSPLEGVSGLEVNYSAEATIDEKETVFTWYNENGEVDGTAVEEQAAKGVFQFLKPGAYYCKMTNGHFSGTELQTDTITITSTINIPDVNFKEALLANSEINTNGDDEIWENEALAFTGEINVYSKDIEDLSGIEYFINITKLNCGENELKNLNVSQNTALTKLICYSNQLSSLDVSKNTNLETLYCDDNQLSSLNIDQNTLLDYLQCSGNQLSDLSVSQNTALTHLICYSNQLSNLDLSQNTDLTALFCHSNQLSSLDLSQNTNLENVSCANNQLSNLDVSKNTNLKTLFCIDNQLSSLDVSENTNLTNLQCNHNKFPFSALQQIKDHYSSLTYTSDSTIFAPQTGVYGHEVNYSTEALFNDITTTFIWYDENGEVDGTAVEEQATKGVFQFLKPGTYYCKMTNGHFSGTELQTDTITITSIVNIPDTNFKNALLANSKINTNSDDEIWENEAAAFTGTLDVRYGSIADLSGIEYFTNITGLDCRYNQFTSLNVSQNTALKILYCSENPLNSLDVSKNTALTHLSCAIIPLSNLDVSNNTKLTHLSCEGNLLKSLDLSQNTLLEELRCFSNQLSSLNVSNNSVLSNLHCENNRLSSLDLSKNTALKNFECENNKFPFSELQQMTTDYKAFAYTSDSTIFSPQEGVSGLEVNYSTEATIDGKETVFTWYDENGEVDGTAVEEQATKGLFQFLKPGTYYCKMTNSHFSGTELQTDTITITSILNIPDTNFKNALLANSKINTNSDDEIWENEAAAFTGTIDVRYGSIADLTGIEYFTNITGLDCRYNQFTSLDVSQNTALKILYCSENPLNSLDVSKNTALTHLSCAIIPLSNLDVSNNTKLTHLSCEGNQINSLDLSQNTLLEELRCFSNQLSSLNVSNNSALFNIHCENNRLSSLDLSKNAALKHFACGNNKFPFSALQQMITDYKVFAYTSDSTIFSPQESGYGFTVDYSAEVSIGGNTTSFTWYDDSGNTINDANVIAETTPGVFQFLAPGIYHCKMTNATFSGLELQTETITINNTIIYFPDANFKKALVENTKINTDGDTKISISEATAFTGELNVAKKNIKDLSGIEYFTQITYLDCSWNLLSNGSLNMSQNKFLTTLNCSYNDLISLDVSQNTALTDLNCSGNRQLSSLDVSKNTDLKILDCENSQLSSLDLSQNTVLTDLNCYSNKFPFSALQQIKDHYSEELKYESNKRIFSALDGTYGFEVNYSAEVTIGENETVFTWYNNDSGEEVDDTAVKETDSSGVFQFLKPGTYYCKMSNVTFPDAILQTDTITIAPTVLNIPDDNFKDALLDNSNINTNGDQEIWLSEAMAVTGMLDLRNKGIEDLTGIEHFANITQLNCGGNGNQLNSLDLSKNTALTHLHCYDTHKVSSLVLSPSITHLYCDNNQLSTLNVSQNTSLIDLRCSNNKLSTLDVSKNTALEKLYCADNQLSSLNLNQNTLLEYLQCSGNQLSDLNVSQNTALTSLYCNENQLSSLDVSKDTALMYLHCNGNQLSSLDVTNLTQLYDLDCSNNQLSSLNVTNLTKLYNLNCSNNFLEGNLDVSNTALEYFYCRNNQLSSLDISNLEELYVLSCDSNQLASLDISLLTYMNELYCSNNQLVSLEVHEHLKKLDCSNNKLNTLNVGDNNNLSVLTCNHNKFPFSALQQIKDNFSGLTYTSDSTLFIPQKGVSGFEVNYSAEVDIDGNTTLFTWHDDSGNTINDANVIAEQSSGIYRFLAPGIYHCIMTNSAFQGTELQTAAITINRDDIINFPNTNFKDALLSHNPVINTDGDSEISYDEAEAFAGELNVQYKQITDLTGIEYFTNITSLNCTSNSLTKLDVSKNTALEKLYCFYTGLSSLDVSQNKKLSHLECSLNKLTSLDVSENEELSYLACHSNELSSLDVSKNIALTDFRCHNNQLSALDVSKNTSVSNLFCQKNQLDALNVSQNPKLTNLNCSENNLNSLDVSSNTLLEILDCSTNQLSSLNLSQNAALEYLKCHENQLSNLDVSLNIKLEELTCHTNSLSTLDVSKNAVLELLDCEDNLLGSLDLSQNKDLYYLYCRNNQLSTLDLSQNVYLYDLYCSNNQLSALDVELQTSLYKLYCDNNQLSALDLSKNTYLELLNCEGNRLTALDLSKNTDLEELGCNNNKFPFSALQEIKESFSGLTYASDSTLFTPQTGEYGFEINYSTEVTINGNTTTFTWYDNSGNVVENESIIAEQSSGVYQFFKHGIYHCKMTNATFSGLELQTETITINAKEQTITFNNLPSSVVVNSSIQLSATASTGLEVRFEVALGDAIISNGNTLTFNQEGEITIKAIQDGNDEYASTEQTATITVTAAVAKKEQNISFNPATEAKVNDVITLEATATSGLDVSFELLSGNATLNGNTITFNEAGTVTIKAVQDGNDEYAAAEQTTIITVSKKGQSISFSPTTEAKVNDVIKLEATADSGLEVSFELVTSNASLNGNTITFTEAGTVTIRAYQNGDDEYEAAEQTATITVTADIAKKEQSISFSPATETKVNDVIKLEATATSGLDVIFELLSGNATLNGSSLTFNEAGTITIKAVQDGDDEYAAAEQTATITVSKKEQSISVADNLPTEFEVNEDLDLSSYISASSGLDVSFEVVTDNASLNGNAITFTGAGTVTVKAIQDGNDEFAAAEKSVEFTVSVPTSINDNELSKTSVSIYPNPVVDEVNIKFTNSSRKMISLYNLTGKLLLQTEAFNTKTMNLSNLPSGMYIMRILQEDQAVSFKIIKN